MHEAKYDWIYDLENPPDYGTLRDAAIELVEEVTYQALEIHKRNHALDLLRTKLDVAENTLAEIRVAVGV